LPVIYLSKYFIENKNDYYAGIRAVTEQGDWEKWVIYILTAIEHTANETRAKIIQIRKLMESTQHLVKEKLPTVYTKDLVELLFESPYCKRQFLEDRRICSRNTASHYLKALESIGVLVSIRAGRDLYFVNRKLINVLKA
jgi:Fic family protein